MKTFFNRNPDGFCIEIEWDFPRLLMKSGGSEDPDEFTVEYNGLTPLGAKTAIKMHLEEWLIGREKYAELEEFILKELEL